MATQKSLGEKKDEVQLKDSWFNPLRVGPPELQMFSVMFASPEGPLDRIIMSAPGFHFRLEEPENRNRVWGTEWDKWDVLPDVYTREDGTRYERPVEEKGILREILEDEFGIIWVGLGRRLHLPSVRYTKWEKLPGKTTEWGLVSKDRENSPFFYFQYTMGLPLQEIETKGNFKVNVRVNVVVRLINPYKAVHLAGGWEANLDAGVQAVMREFLGPMTVEELRESTTSADLAERITTLNPRLEKHFGVTIINIELMSFDVKGNPEVEAALNRTEVERLHAEAARHTAERIRILSTADADAARRMVEAYQSGEAAAMVRSAELTADAIKTTNASVVALGTGTNMPVAITPPDKEKKPKK